MTLMEPLTSDTKFRIRAFGVSELAMLYNPHLTGPSATRQLKRWIDYHPLLEKKLKRLGYLPGQRCLTPKQVECIVEHLGEP